MRNKTQIFSFIKDRVWHRVQNWKNRFLSRAGKELLIKTVAQALPTYTMSVFCFPLQLCTDIERALNAFWWSTSKGSRTGIHWLSWKKLIAHKSCGGVSFKKLQEFNLAMLGKKKVGDYLLMGTLLWQEFTRPATTPKVIFLNAKLGNNPSFLWRSLLAAHVRMVHINLNFKFKLNLPSHISPTLVTLQKTCVDLVSI